MATPDRVRFTCTALQGVNKAGMLLPDQDGYYDHIVGGLNVLNSVGELYVYEQARELFESPNSAFIRRVQRGVLGGEWGHPKMLPNMTEQQYLQRIMSIEESNVCCHHREIYIDKENVTDHEGRPVIAIMSRLKPSGPQGSALKESLENKHENICFSIRAFTDDYYRNGRRNRVLKHIITFDRVTEPGIAFAEKYKSPALEDFVGIDASRNKILRAMDNPRIGGLSQEGVVLHGEELCRVMGWDRGVNAAWQGW